jgi:hypothetical protein
MGRWLHWNEAELKRRELAESGKLRRRQSAVLKRRPSPLARVTGAAKPQSNAAYPAYRPRAILARTSSLGKSGGVGLKSSDSFCSPYNLL